jgi:hypothetical protein
MASNNFKLSLFTPEISNHRKIHSFIKRPENYFRTQGHRSVSEHYYSPNMVEDEIDFSGSSSSSSDEDLSEMANFDDIYQDLINNEYGLE